MATGKSFDAFGGVVGICHKTLYNWMESHEDFHDAKLRGELMALNWWEGVGISGMLGEIKGFNPVSWIFLGKCRFRKYGYKDVAAEEIVPKATPEQAHALLASLTEMVRDQACLPVKSSEPQSAPSSVQASVSSQSGLLGACSDKK